MSYPVGTICIGQNFVVNTERNGMECVIEAPAQYMEFIGIQDDRRYKGVFYKVRWADGYDCPQEPKYLRLKRHDDEDKEARGRVKDREKVSKLISDCLKAIEAGEKA